MDRKINKRKNIKIKKNLIILSLIIVTILISYKIYKSNIFLNQQRIPLDSVTLSKVKFGTFEENLRLRGTVEPKKTIFLDAVSGGRVEEILIEQGEFVEKDQPLIALSNSSLQLDVISREAQITEQLNFLRNTQMTTETNKLNLKRDLIEIEHKLAGIKRRLKQAKVLIKSGVIANNDLLNLEDDLEYYENRKRLTLERQDSEKLIRKAQIDQLEDSAKRLESNLKIARENLRNLLVRAPISGFLSDLDVVVGESKSQGARLGQIDYPDSYKLSVFIDEYYLNEIQPGMPVNIYINDKTIKANISKVDSKVNDAKFLVEVDMPGNPGDIKSGQSLDLDIILSKPEKDSLMLSKGAFINSTGGQWVFVVTQDGDKAYRREIKLGRKNSVTYQIADGLNSNDIVITSGYDNFINAQELIIY
ncbi:efflux RND transporter periplasmic adaptor subunit [Microbulbifer sp. EKSA005]|uniref:efflux RND transporter periplasmic adaptor subunit n=1 Tax=Microbulbifer sp. EKSA005 TaxID=3243364 RepID=UPI0040423983